MKLKAILFLGVFLISQTPDIHAFTFYDITSWLANTWNSARSRFTTQESPQFFARLRSLFSTQQPAPSPQPTSLKTPPAVLSSSSPQEVSAPMPEAPILSAVQTSHAQEQDLQPNDLFASDSLDFALEIGSTSGFGNPGTRAYFSLERENNPRDFMAMLIYDINNYLIGQNNTGQEDIINLAIQVENVRNPSLKERQQMYQDIIRLIGRLYTKRSVRDLEYKVKSLFAIPSNFPIKAYLNFTNNVQDALNYMLKNPSLYHKKEIEVLEGLQDWFVKLKPLPQAAIDAMNKAATQTKSKGAKKAEPAVPYAQQISPDEFFTSDMLYTLDKTRKEGALLALRNQQTHYALNYLLDFLDIRLLKNEHSGLIRYIKGWSRPEYIEKQNPNFYTDFIKEIGQAYMNARASDIKTLDDKLLYIFGGTTDYEKNLSNNLQQAISDLLALSINNPALEKHHQILQHILKIAQISFGNNFVGNQNPTARL